MNPEVISAIADCFVALFTLIGISIAFAGLHTWRNQLHGTNEYELARKILLQVYRLRESLRLVRNPFLSISEADAEQKDIPWEVSAYERRWSTVRDAYTELNVSLLEAEVMWGDLLKEARSELDDRKLDLQFAVEMFIMMKQDKNYANDFKEYRDTLYSRATDDDYGKRLNDSITKYEQALKPYVARRPGGHLKKLVDVLFKAP